MDRVVRLRREKKLLLLISERNPVFDEIKRLEGVVGYSFACVRDAAEDKPGKAESIRLEGRNKRSLRHELLRVSAETLRKWNRWDIAGGARPERSIEALRGALVAMEAYVVSQSEASPLGDEDMACLNEQIARVVRFKADYDDPKQATDVYATAKSLGMAIVEAQRAIDSAAYAGSPLLLRAYRDKEKAESELAKIGGLYRLWVRRTYGEVDTWLRCSLHVRYVLGVDSRYVLRVKLNFPALDPALLATKLAKPGFPGGHEYFEYDGICDVQKRLNWIMEKREDSRPDFFFFISSARREFDLGAGQHFTGMVGQYLTSHQDEEQSVVAGPVILEPVPTPSGSTCLSLSPEVNRALDVEDWVKSFMWEGPATLHADDPQCTRLDEVAEQLGVSRPVRGSKSL